MKKSNSTLYRIMQLASGTDLNILISLLIIRHSSKAFAPSCTQSQTPWNKVVSAPNGASIRAITDALRMLVPRVPALDILAEALQSAQTDEAVLREIIELLSNLSPENTDLSGIFEYRLGKEAWTAPSASGDFYTPTSVVRLLIDLLSIDGGTIYDPCCGSGAMLYQAFLRTAQKTTPRLYGQTADPITYQICGFNALLHNFQIDLSTGPANTLTDDLHACRKFDFVLSNPPFNLSHWCDETYSIYDARWKYGLPPRSNANFAWLQHIISHLSEKGRAAVILPNGTLTAQTHSERTIRRGILQDGFIEAIIALPAKLFLTTKIPCCVWLLNKNEKPDATTLLVDAEQFKLTGDKIEAEQNIRKLTELILQHRNGSLQGRTDWYAVVSAEEIAQKNGLLSPNLYTHVKPLPMEPIQQNRPRFMELLEKLNRQPLGLPLSTLVQQWRYTEPSAHWEKAFVTELFQVFGGISKKKEAFVRGTPMADVKTVIRNMFLPDTLPACVEAAKDEIQKYGIKAGDILLNRTSETIEELACCCLATTDRNAVYSSYVKRLRLLQNDILNPYYAAAYFRSAVYRREVKKISPVFTTRANMNMERLSEITVYYPGNDMQKSLGETLYAVSRFQTECRDKKQIELLDKFTELLIEQFITYPILCRQKEEDNCR